MGLLPFAIRVALPIDDVLPAIRERVRQGRDLVIVAPPGAGKTTRVPPALLDLIEGRILVLQPRRVAARTTAQRMADELGTPVGRLVGYQVRFERRISAETRIEVLTEGLLTRRLQGDPFLEGVGCVILDEFHERSLHVDLALALLREVQREARPDLRLIVMSATLDPGPVADFLDAETITSAGRTFPVEKSWRAGDGSPVAVASAVRQTLSDQPDGHVLVFLPGVREIERTAQALTGVAAEVHALHGRLSAAAQTQALAPSSGRKVVLSTNIAETSVTLPGVRAVVDTGLARVPRFEPKLGLTRLDTQRISRASADQRAGRAGRTGPGVCVRLWSEAEDRGLVPHHRPAIHREDLTRACLEVSAWGADPSTFGWFERPSQEALEHAIKTLNALEAIGPTGITSVGRTLVALPLDPRLAQMVRLGAELGAPRTTATLAALLEERDIGGSGHGSDLTPRLQAVDGGRAPRVAKARDQMLRQMKAKRGSAESEESALRAFVRAFPERVGRRRDPQGKRFHLAGGAGATLDRRSAVHDAPLIAALVVTGGRRGERAEHMVRVAAPIEEGWLPTSEAVEASFDAERLAVAQRMVRRFGALVLAELPAGKASNPSAVWAALAEAAAADPERAFDLVAAGPWLARIRWLAARRPKLELPTYPELSAPSPAGPLIQALCHGRRSFADLRKMNLAAALRDQLLYPQRQALDLHAPERLALPDGRSAKLEYSTDKPPVLAARIQQLFGWTETPRVDGEPVLLHLLAPNYRPAQITDDLAGFWTGAYAAVRKQLRGRYPKHAWPEDPLKR